MKRKELNEKFELCLSVLGEPYYKNDKCAIYNIDCVEGLQKLQDQCCATLFALTVTSPPYNIGKEYERKISLQDYLLWCEKWLGLIHGNTDAFGSLWLNLGYCSVPQIGKAVPLSYMLWDKTNFYLMQEIVWHYGAGVACKKYLSPRNEKILWFVKDQSKYIFNLDDIRDPNVKYPNQKKNGKLRCNPKGKNPSDVWSIPKVTSGKNRSSSERTKHPAQFPEKVIERCIKAGSHEGDLILDPFLGSGTTAVVAINTNRFVIVFELRKDYCDIAVERIKKTIGKRETQRKKLKIEKK